MTEPRTTTSGVSTQTGRARVLALAAILLAAVNLRLAVTSVGPVLAEIRANLHMSGTVAGLLGSVPVLCFAVVGPAAPRLARRLGPTRVILVGFLLVVVGLAVRPYAPAAALFLLFSVLALAGIAVVNVLLPVVVKQRFPTQVGAVTGLYSVALNVGATAAAALTVPLTTVFGGDWRLGLACWALVAALTVPAWFMLARRPTPPTNQDQSTNSVRVSRSPVAWGLAVYFGLQSVVGYVIIGWLAQIYRDAGIPADTAGVLFALTSFFGVPLSFVLSAAAGRMRSQSGLTTVLCLFGLAGYAGLWWSPAAAAWVWAVLLGVANCAFPLALTMIALRGRTPATVAGLSAFTQSVGYVLGIPGPIMVGYLHDRTGGWRVPLALMIAVTITQLIAGLVAGRNRMV